jgi:ankyrin repeat protein
VLLAAGADVRSRAKLKDTPLHHAAESGHQGVVKVLLDAALAAGMSVDEQMAHGSSPLLQAAMEGHTQVVQL